MKAIHAAYTQEVYANLRPLHATWEPTQTVRVGDVGILQNRAFRQQTDLRTLGIEFSIRNSTTRANIYFGSRGNTEMRLIPGITAISGLATQKASIELDFASEGAVFFTRLNANQ
jgi:hypothetical protein